MLLAQVRTYPQGKTQLCVYGDMDLVSTRHGGDVERSE